VFHEPTFISLYQFKIEVSEKHGTDHRDSVINPVTIWSVIDLGKCMLFSGCFRPFHDSLQDSDNIASNLIW